MSLGFLFNSGRSYSQVLVLTVLFFFVLISYWPHIINSLSFESEAGEYIVLKRCFIRIV